MVVERESVGTVQSALRHAQSVGTHWSGEVGLRREMELRNFQTEWLARTR